MLPGEKEELVNDGMYGKALAKYVQEKLRARGYHSPFFCCEDWGWWVHLKDAPFTFGVRIYCGQEIDGLLQLSCVAGAPEEKKWSWRRFRFVDASPLGGKTASGPGLDLPRRCRNHGRRDVF
jgi:hypothetical protein